MKKITLIILFLFSALLHARASSSVSWKKIDRYIQNSSPNEFKNFHKEVVNLYSSLDKKEKLKKASFFWNLLISTAIAEERERCFYGGWISVKVGGNCQPPWRLREDSMMQNNYSGHVYTRDHTCGPNDVMRCNPILFGSGQDGAECVQIEPTERITERCFEASANYLPGHLEVLQNDPNLRSQFSTMVSEVLEHCEGRNNHSCHNMANAIEAVVEAPTIGDQDLYSCQQAIIQSIGDTSAIEEIIRMVGTEPPKVPGIWEPNKEMSDAEACNIPGLSDEQKENCENLLANGDVPRNALLFTLDGIKRNADEFKTNKCFDKESSYDQRFRDGHYSLGGMSSPSDFTEKMDGGIKNKCRFIINDVGDRLESHGGELKCLMRTHIVNICTGESRKTKSWVGYGTCKRGRGNKNQTDQGTTLLGFQVTNDKSFGFAKSDASYNNIRSRFKKKFGAEDSFGNNSYRIPAISLFGLQTTNNRSMQDYKYLHIGAYTSAGCPSLIESEENYNVIEQLAKDGPSVVVNYKEGKMEDYEKCEERDE